MSIKINKSEIPGTVIEAKRWWREEIRRALKETSEEYRSAASASIALNVLGLPEVETAKTILAYCSVGSEPGTLAIISKLLSQGKRVCLPLCVDIDDQGRRMETTDAMEAREIESFDDLRAGAYGIPEPAAHTAVVSPRDIDLIILPCLACDKSCMRIGHGAGYYDKYLSKVREDCVTIALCFDAVLADELPAEEHDVPASAVITETAVYRREPAMIKPGGQKPEQTDFEMPKGTVTVLR